MVHLKPRGERKHLVDESSSDFVPNFGHSRGKGLSSEPAGSSYRWGGHQESLSVHTAVTRQAGTLRSNREAGARVGEEFSLRDVTSDLQIKAPQVKVNILRDKAAALGLMRNRLRTHSTTLMDRDGYRPSTRMSTNTAFFSNCCPSFSRILGLVHVVLQAAFRPSDPARRPG